MSVPDLVLVGNNNIGGTFTLTGVTSEKKQIVFFGRNSINGHDVPSSIHDIPEGTSEIVIEGVCVRFKDQNGADLRIVTF